MLPSLVRDVDRLFGLGRRVGGFEHLQGGESVFGGRAFVAVEAHVVDEELMVIEAARCFCFYEWVVPRALTALALLRESDEHFAGMGAEEEAALVVEQLAAPGEGARLGGPLHCVGDQAA